MTTVHDIHAEGEAKLAAVKAHYERELAEARAEVARMRAALSDVSAEAWRYQNVMPLTPNEPAHGAMARIAQEADAALAGGKGESDAT